MIEDVGGRMATKATERREAEFRRLRRALVRRRRQQDAARIRQAREKAARVCDLLKRDYGVTEVYLYGSLAWGGFGEASDIDLLVVGAKGSYWQMYLAAESAAAPFPVHLVDLADASPSLREEVLRRGIRM